MSSGEGGVKPQGMVRAGWPVRLEAAVFEMMPAARETETISNKKEGKRENEEKRKRKRASPAPASHSGKRMQLVEPSTLPADNKKGSVRPSKILPETGCCRKKEEEEGKGRKRTGSVRTARHSHDHTPTRRMTATLEDVAAAGSRLGFVPPTHHQDDYVQLLQGTDNAAKSLLALPGARLNPKQR